MNRIFNRQNFLILCWALYDTSNQFFVLNVISVYFPRWLTDVKNVPAFYYSLAFAGSMIFVAFCAPFLGTISDIQKRRKHHLIGWTLVSVVFTFLIGTTDSALWGLLYFAVANFGCQLAIVFYNALLVHVAGREKTGMVSGIGRMFGYSGALLAMLLSKPVIQAHGYQATLMVTAGLFLLFALPAMIFIREKDFRRDRPLVYFFQKERLGDIYYRIRESMFRGTEFQEARLLLGMSFFGMCALQTVGLFIGVYGGEVFRLNENQIIDLIFVSTLFAVAGSFVSGYLADRFGHKRIMTMILGLWIAGFLIGGLSGPPFHWLVGILIGLALSGTWAVGRAWVVKLVPDENMGEVFGLYNLTGYAAGVVGPLFWGLILVLSSPLGVWRYRISLLSLTLFIGAAYYFLRKIPSGPIGRR